MTRKTVLFISHSASRTGAPIVFLNFIRWFKKNSKIPFKVILREGGPLQKEFEQLSPVMVYPQSYNRDLAERALNKLGFSFHPILIKKYLNGDEIGLIYSNTSTNHEVLNALNFLECPVISHIHELEYAIQVAAGAHFSTTKLLTDYYIAASEAVRQNLLSQHHISDDCVDTLHESIPVLELDYELALSKRTELRAQLGIPSDAFVVGSSGVVCWRKGADLFIQLAHKFCNKYQDMKAYFVWIGGDRGQRIYSLEIQHDVRKLNLEQTVKFLGSKSNALDYFAVFDVFTLLSREDPYPLVCLEAALLGKPIVCFDDAGGAKEFVEDDCGFVVPYMDIEAVADKVYSLLSSPALRIQMGTGASNKIKSRHDTANTAATLNQIIQKFIA